MRIQMLFKLLTFATVFKVAPNAGSIGDGGRNFAVEKGADAPRQTPVVHVIQLAVVIRPCGRAKEQKGAAQKLRLQGAGTAASLDAVGHQLLVDVEIEADVGRHLLCRHSQPWRLV